MEIGKVPRIKSAVTSVISLWSLQEQAAELQFTET